MSIKPVLATLLLALTTTAGARVNGPEHQRLSGHDGRLTMDRNLEFAAR